MMNVLEGKKGTGFGLVVVMGGVVFPDCVTFGNDHAKILKEYCMGSNESDFGMFSEYIWSLGRC